MTLSLVTPGRFVDVHGGRIVESRGGAPPGGRGHGAKAVLVGIPAVQGDRRLRDYDDRRPGLALARVDSEVPGSARDDRPDVPVLDLVAPACLEDDLRQVLPAMGDLEVDRLRGRVQAVKMAFEFEDPALVRANSFEDPVPVKGPWSNTLTVASDCG